MKSDASPEELIIFAKNAALMHGGVFVDLSKSYRDYCDKVADAYVRLIKMGVAPEQARSILPLSTMTEWRWTGSLAAWARFCRQRMAPDAQEETRQVATQVAAKMAELFPVSWSALA